jgi:subtilisin family serine protease
LPYLNKHDIILVAAAGNEGIRDPAKIDLQTPPRLAQAGLPGEHTLVIAGATDKENVKAALTNDFGDLVTAYTVGLNILTPLHSDNNGYGLFSGTSASTAFTSALISTWLVRDDFDFRNKDPGTVAAWMKAQLGDIAKFHTKYQEVTDAVDVLGTFNYIPCDDDDFQGSANLSLVQPRAANVGTPIRQNNMLVTSDIGVCHLPMTKLL